MISNKLSVVDRLIKDTPLTEAECDKIVTAVHNLYELVKGIFLANGADEIETKTPGCVTQADGSPHVFRVGAVKRNFTKEEFETRYRRLKGWDKRKVD